MWQSQSPRRCAGPGSAAPWARLHTRTWKTTMTTFVQGREAPVPPGVPGKRVQRMQEGRARCARALDAGGGAELLALLQNLHRQLARGRQAQHDWPVAGLCKCKVAEPTHISSTPSSSRGHMRPSRFYSRTNASAAGGVCMCAHHHQLGLFPSHQGVRQVRANAAPRKGWALMWTTAGSR